MTRITVLEMVIGVELAVVCKQSQGRDGVSAVASME